MIKTLIEKGRQIKSRGIALTHRDQGYSANNRHVSLLTKSDIDPSKLTVDVIKALEQVQVTISMEEFLRRFFHMYYDDAELLTKLLGFTTTFEDEYADKDPEDLDSYTADYIRRHQEYLDEKLETITIIKKAKEGADLSLVERFELIKTRKQFEDGCKELGLDFGDNSELRKPETGEVVKSATKPEPVSSAGATTTIKETPVEKEVDVTKSQQFIDLMKANEALMAQVEGMKETFTAAQEIVKAQAVAKREVALNKAASFGFVADDQREAVADLIEDPAKASVVAVLEKAAAALKEKDEALVAKDAEIEEIKKSFADGKEVGADGQLTEVAKGSEDAQARLNRVIAERAAEIAKAANGNAEFINA
ncbi:hypothetical protein [Escherichia phage vB_EcoM-LTH01]